MAVQQVRIVLTERGANALAQITAGFVSTAGVTHFKVGEGGFVIVSGVKFPKDPTNAQKMLDSEDPALIPVLTTLLGHTPFVFQKNFTPLGASNNFQIETNVIFRANPLVDFGEANDNGVGGAPRFFEIGLFMTNTVTNRTVGVGDGVTVNFVFTAPALPVEPGTFVLTFTNPGPPPTVKTVNDDGAGNLLGDIASGVNTINYQTGAVNVTFDTAPGLGVEVKTSYTSKPLFLYGTYPEEIKTPLIQLKKIVRVAY